MTRLPNPKSKTATLIFKAKPEQEVETRAFKELCARNGISMSTELYERGIKPFLKEHNWPPGNSQTLLSNSFEKPKIAPKVCAVCGLPAEFQSIKPVKAYFCLKHFNRKKHESWKELK